MNKQTENIDEPSLPERVFTPIRIHVKLRRSQFTGVMNKWICTIHGEKREVTMREVEWYCMNVEDAIHSFKVSEIEEFTINGKYSVDL